MKLLKVLFISCQHASELVSKKHNVGLNRSEKIRLTIHTNMCSVCKSLEKQTELIEEAIQSKLKQEKTHDLSVFKTETINKIK